MEISTNYDNVTCQTCLKTKPSKSPSSTYVKITRWSAKNSLLNIKSGHNWKRAEKELQRVSHCLLCSSSLMLRRRSLISLPATTYQDGFMPNRLIVTSHDHHLVCLGQAAKTRYIPNAVIQPCLLCA